MEGEIQRDGSFLGSPLLFRCLRATAEGAVSATPRRTRKPVQGAPALRLLLQQHAEKVVGYLVRRGAPAAAARYRRGGWPEGSSGAPFGVALAEEVFLPRAELDRPRPRLLGLLGLRRRLEEIRGLGELPGAWARPADDEGPAWCAGQECHEQDTHRHEQRQSHVRGARCDTDVGRGRNQRRKERKSWSEFSSTGDALAGGAGGLPTGRPETRSRLGQALSVVLEPSHWAFQSGRERGPEKGTPAGLGAKAQPLAQLE